MTHVFPVAVPPRTVRQLLADISVPALLVVSFCFALATWRTEDPLWILLVLLVSFCGLLAYIALAPRFLRYEVSPNRLRIRGDPFYGRTIPISDLRLEAVEVTDLAQSPAYRLQWRSNGTGLPGYKAGWFTLANGRRALVFLRDNDRLVIVPHRKDYLLVLSPADPKGFVRALRDTTTAP